MTRALHSPRFWILTVAALVVAGTTFSLGQWQLRRAAQKEALQAAVDSKGRLPALDARSLLTAPNITDDIHRPATLKGSWRADHTVYLDNRPMSGKTGFVVVTPLVLEGSAQVILVQRGWVPRNFADRTRLPDVATPAGAVTVEGRIAPPPSRLYEFTGAESGRIRQNLDLPAFRTETGLPLLEVSLLQTGAASEGLLREWAAPNLGVDKHYGYAFQWFGLCGLMIILYGWFQLVLPLRSHLRNSSRGEKSRDPLP
ncbi:surfeit locus 1 family protein [Polaromonas sp. YR568]|uniref:SURF1 family protein n=1 Tax=Polaromonas sp. YR568 TaxID=1855301 RepID=UPI0008EDF778|nr:SURF1 family protein [Polaromonas sp. YR568]SFU96928.1 surfeit locus 1 family protein [Polaromonas sp. YR568]